MSLFGTMPEFAEAFASEERRKFAAPSEREAEEAEEADPDEQEESDADADLFPYDEGYEARVCCHARETNPYMPPISAIRGISDGITRTQPQKHFSSPVPKWDTAGVYLTGLESFPDNRCRTYDLHHQTTALPSRQTGAHEA